MSTHLGIGFSEFVDVGCRTEAHNLYALPAAIVAALSQIRLLSYRQLKSSKSRTAPTSPSSYFPAELQVLVI